MAACLQRPWYYWPVSIDSQQVSYAHGSICTGDLIQIEKASDGHSENWHLDGLWWWGGKKPGKVVSCQVWTSLNELDCPASTCYVVWQNQDILLSLCHAPQNRCDSPASLWGLLASRNIGNGLGKNDSNVPCLRLIYSREREKSEGLWQKQKLDRCRLT